MTPGEMAGLVAKLDALHEDVLEVKELAKETNGRVRRLETWKAEVTGKLSVISEGARISITSFVAPILSGSIVAVLGVAAAVIFAH